MEGNPADSGGTSSVPDGGKNSLALVRPEQSLEQRVGKRAVIKLREELSITHPALEGLLFLPQNFAVFYGLKATLEEIGASVTKKAYERRLTEAVTQYIEGAAELRQRKGIGARVFGENAHYHLGKKELDGDKLVKLARQAYNEAFSEQLRRVEEIGQACFYHQQPDLKYIQQRLEGLVKEASSFVKNFSLVPVSDSMQQEAWRAIIPVVEKMSLFFGLYSQEKAKPFESSGTSLSQSRTESPMPQYTLLEQPYGAALADKFLMLIEIFNGDLGQFVARVAPFVKKEEKLPADLQVHLALFNYFLNGLYCQNGDKLSGSYATCLNTALNGISSHLKPIFSFIEDFELKELGGDYEVIHVIENAGFKVKGRSGTTYYYYAATKPLNK